MNAPHPQATWYVAESHGGDAARSVRLGGFLVPTRRPAVRRLRRQARRFADALDPDPYTPGVPGRALYPVGAAGRRDAPAELRSRVASFREHDHALGRLADGLPYEFVARDATVWCGLVMRPSAAAARTSSPPHRQG
ncbi:hypothetical protein [Streptomyces globisporus]|uniref:hypothetical protein n=1 Tax=Streptomyces globisporus TaxID=1908 RepID=UPI0036AC83CA